MTRERIGMLEDRPKPDWFVKVRDQDGEIQWFLRFSITGLATRLYGPFGTKRTCLLFLDSAINALIDGYAQIDDCQNKYRLPDRPFKNRGWHYPIVENEIIKHAPSVNRKKPGAA